MAKKRKLKLTFYDLIETPLPHNEKEWVIYYGDDMVGRLYKHTGWSGSSWRATHYSVEIAIWHEYEGEEMAENREFKVRSGNSRRALAAAKKWARGAVYRNQPDEWLEG